MEVTKKVSFRKNPNVSKRIGIEVRKSNFDVGHDSKY